MPVDAIKIILEIGTTLETTAYGYLAVSMSTTQDLECFLKIFSVVTLSFFLIAKR